MSRPDSSSIDADEHGTTGGEIKYLWVPLYPFAAPHAESSLDGDGQGEAGEEAICVNLGANNPKMGKETLYPIFICPLAWTFR